MESAVKYVGWPLVACVIAATLWAQDKPLRPVPQYDEVFYRYDQATGKLIDLERQVAAVASKPKAIGFGGYKAFFYLRGEQSPVRFQQGDPMEFVVALPPRTDPHTVQFFILHPTRDRRELLQQESNRPSPLGVGKSHSVLNRYEIPYEIQKYGESTYQIIPSKPLLPGEYSLSFSTNNAAFLFGIDGGDDQGKRGK